MKVICNKAKTCTLDRLCGAKNSHEDSSCEPCPFDKRAKCVEITKTVLCFQGEEHYLKGTPE